ncbi:MAG: Twin-arginine translocation protein TatC [Candidatus Carbobacillus altaicus]|uniref:Sec-independent protein translocase protein TatC n=1 Tax=Candidatus Carbonibacillus altaicus TaxID=2163959 RepID=A0A2R6XZK4_9BACL|nr:MAG: Twin-arginine translocation protein TatC [Candidatus Carbobacillus altaicus]
MLETFERSSVRRYLDQYGVILWQMARRLLILFIIMYGVALIASPFVFRHIIAETWPLVIFNYEDGLALMFRLAFLLTIIVMVPVATGYVLFEIYRRGWMRSVRLLFGTGLAAVVLFFLGLAFAAFVLLPFLITFIARLGKDFHIEPMYGAVQYTSFLVGLMLPMGVFFELPLVITLIVRLRLVSLEKLKSIRKYVYFFLYVIASMITPPDVMTHVMAALPLIALYEIGLFAAKKMSPTK